MDIDVASSASVRTVESTAIDEYAQLASERFAPLKMRTDRHHDFRGRIRGRQLGEISLFDVRATQHQVERSERIASSTPQQKYMLHFQMSGVGVMRQGGREAVLRPGELAFYDSDKPYSLSLDDQFRNTILVFPQRMLALLPATASQLTAVRLPGTDGVAGMVASLLGGLAENMGRLPRHSSVRFAHSVVDLVAEALQGELGLSSEHSVATDRDRSLQQILAYIEDHLADPDLGPEQLAAANFISVRTLHSLFNRAGTSVAAWIRTRRLERCHEDLANPRLEQLPVGTVMTRYGFVSTAHFSRLFRSTYGESPTEFRKRMRIEAENGR